MPMGVENETGVSDEGSPPQCIMETNATTPTTERYVVHESGNQMTADEISSPDNSKYSGGSGILKGGKFWRCFNMNSSIDCKPAINTDTVDLVISSTSSAVGDDHDSPDNDKRSVKFMQESLFLEESCPDKTENHEKGEFTLTFNLGNRVVPCNSLKPNSAVRQLFPDPRFVDPLLATASQRDCQADCAGSLGMCEGKYFITEESLQAFNEVNRRSVFASSGGKECRSYKDVYSVMSSDTEDIAQNHLIKKTIERNRLRRSLIQYPRSAGGGNHLQAKKKMELSLEERIKLLTCDIDDEPRVPNENTDQGMSSTSEYTIMLQHTNLSNESSYQYREAAVSSSTILSSTYLTTTTTTATICNTSTILFSSSEQEKTSTYEKFPDLLRKTSDNEQMTTVEQQLYPNYQSVCQSIQANLATDTKIHEAALIMGKKSTSSHEARPQFSSSLASSTSRVTSHVKPSYGMPNFRSLLIIRGAFFLSIHVYQY